LKKNNNKAILPSLSPHNTVFDLPLCTLKICCPKTIQKQQAFKKYRKIKYRLINYRRIRRGRSLS